MDSGIITIFLPIALAIIMAGLGLELRPQDFKRVAKHPKAVFLALFCQLVILVSIAFVICKLLALPPLLAVGVMLLASTTIAMPAAVYSIFMYIFAAIFGTLLNRYEPQRAETHLVAKNE